MTLARKNSHLGQAINVSYSTTGDSLLIPSSGNVTVTNSLTLSSQTVNTIAGFDSNQKLISLTTSTYPSFTELSYLKGVTSSLQTQIDNKSSSTHVHGNISNGGAIGSTANLPLITTTAGLITVGSFGTSANTFCQGNDSRLSDNRTPSDGSVTTVKIVDSNVTYAKIQNVSATSRILGRSSSGAGIIEELDAATARTVLSVQPTASPAFTGAATFDNTGNVVPVTITNAGTANSFVVNDASGDTTPFVIDAAGRVGIGASPSSSGSSVFQARGDIDIHGNDADRSITYNIGVGDAGITGWYRSKIAFVPSGAANNISQSIVFSTKDGDLGGSALTERFRIGHTGTATFAGQIVGQAGAVLTGTVAGNVRQLRMQTSGSTRWEVGPGFDAESGSNVGSTFWITRWSDAGAFLGTPFAIDRATGRATFENTVVVPLGSVSSCSVAPFSDLNTGLYFPAADVAAIVTNGTERVRVDASGNVGIGVTPSTWGSTVNQVIELKNGVSVSSNSAVAAGYFCTNITSSDGFGTSIYKITAHGHAYLQNAGDHIFYTAPSGTAGNTATLTERFKISSDNGKITAAGVYNNTVGGTNRDVFVDSGGLIGYVSSIRESKTDIVTLDDVSWLSALAPVSYRYRKRNADGTYSDEADGVTDYGLIAEEVEAVRPELCFYDDVDGEPQLRGVTYSKLITPMLRYIQQLEARIAALEERLSNN